MEKLLGLSGTMRLESAQNHAKSDLLHSRKLNRIRAVFICSGARQHRASHWTLLKVNGSLCARFTSPICFATTVSFLEAPRLVHVAKKLLPPPKNRRLGHDRYSSRLYLFTIEDAGDWHRADSKKTCAASSVTLVVAPIPLKHHVYRKSAP